MDMYPGDFRAPGLLLEKSMKIKILGTEYKIKHVKADEAKVRDADGYHEPYSKEIVLVDIPKSSETVENIEEYEKEEVVDWIALQFPKLLDVFRETECI